MAKLKLARKQLNLLHTELAAAKKAYHQAAFVIMARRFRLLFKFVPTLQSFRWVQYSPYYNNGAECGFDRKEIERSNIKLACASADATRVLYNYLNKVLNLLPDESYQTWFGNHVDVTVTPTEIIVQPFNHA